jgi:hypothetical protein
MVEKMRTDELLGEYELFLDKWNRIYRKVKDNPVLPHAGDKYHKDLMEALNVAGISVEDLGTTLRVLDHVIHEKMDYERQDEIVGQWQEAEFERKMEEGIVKAENSFEPDAHSYTKGDGL